MPRDPLAWLPLLRHWTRCLGAGGEAISRLGDLSDLPDLDLTALLPGGPGWADVQRSLQHDPEGCFRLLYYGLALRGLEALPAPELLVPEGSAEPPEISVLIPVHNHWAITHNALRSLVAMTNSVRFEVILADDASSDATIQMVRQLPWLRVWRSERNRGFLDTCNAAAVMARGDVLLLLNNDTLVGDQALDQIWSTFQRRPKAGVVGAAFWGADGYPQEVGGIVWASGQVWNHGRGFPPMRWFALEGERHCDYVSGCGLSIRHSLWQQLEGFDPLYRPAYAEDTDLCLRVRQAGHEVWVQPQARILHLEGLSHSRDSNQGMKQHQAVNLLHLKERWQTYLDAQQPPEGLPWLLAADRGLLGRPLAVLLEPALEAKSICMQLGWAPLVVDERWSFQWLVQHLNGPLLPEIALVGEPPAGCPIPEGWMQRDYPAQLPQRSSASKLRLPGLPGWDREDLRVLASSTGLHPDGWLETDSRIVVERMKESRPTEALRIQLYLPEEGPEGAASRAQIKFESEAKSLHVILQEGLNNVNLHPSRDADTCLVINIKSQSVIRPKDMQDQRQLLAVLADIGMIEEG